MTIIRDLIDFSVDPAYIVMPYTDKLETTATSTVKDSEVRGIAKLDENYYSNRKCLKTGLHSTLFYKPE